jgi:hypothetical protein
LAVNALVFRNDRRWPYFPEPYQLEIFLDQFRYATTRTVGMPLAGFLVGMLWFEILVYIGVRKCRYANREKPSAS